MERILESISDTNIDIIKAIHKIKYHDEYPINEVLKDVKESLINTFNEYRINTGDVSKFYICEEHVSQINKLKGETDKEKIINLLESIIERQNNFKKEYLSRFDNKKDYVDLVFETYYDIEEIIYESHVDFLYEESDYIGNLIDDICIVTEAPVTSAVKTGAKAGKAVVKGAMKVWEQLLNLVRKVRELFMSKMKKIQERDAKWIKDNKKTLTEVNTESLEVRIHSDYGRTLNQATSTLNSFKQLVSSNIKTTDYDVFRSKLKGYVDKNGDLKIGLTNKYRTGDCNREYEIKVLRGNDVKNAISPLINFCEGFINSIGDINKKFNEEENFIKGLEREMKNRDITMENYCYIEEMYYNETDLGLYYDFSPIMEAETNQQADVKTEVKGEVKQQQTNDTKKDKVGVDDRNKIKEKTDKMSDKQLTVYNKICRDNHLGISTYLTTMEKKYFESITILRGLIK